MRSGVMEEIRTESDVGVEEWRPDVRCDLLWRWSGISSFCALTDNGWMMRSINMVRNKSYDVRMSTKARWDPSPSFYQRDSSHSAGKCSPQRLGDSVL